ncbi:armadillo/beta-catenin-like repeat-containing protein [Virgisporangium ochraceum]|uniref:PBS lyase HEAT domain protein repeat-containing protein n=1 Tax=Virgisporangium ochraceum TaxID=65505 RepID=A0A8J4A156_9ACTN|nr:armadillo/beta-catenin-like repeat-containing protein [Virgisporangium ochraceum]GIJ73919.1 hypothetical protein Voc01_088360 [Virgisporangium ochraceum]
MPWARLWHHYGRASDVPGLLRGCAGPDGERALDDLDNVLFHQGGWICPAASAALPYLLDLAHEPDMPVRLGVVRLVGRLVREAARVDPRFLDPDWPDALAGAVPRLLALLRDPDPRIRREATWVAGSGCLPFSDTVDALWERWSAERDGVTRWDLVLAFGGVAAARPDVPDAAGIRAELRRLLHDDDLQLRLAAVHALAAHEPDVAVAEVATAVRAVRHTDSAGWADSAWHGDHPRAIVHTTAELYRHDPTAAAAFTVGVGGGRGDDRTAAALDIAGSLLEEWRTVTPALLPLLEQGLGHRDAGIRFRAAHLVGCLGQDAAGLRESVAALVTDAAAGDEAVWALARLGDPRCVPGLVDRLTGPVRGFAESAAYFGRMPAFAFLPPGIEETLVPLRRHADVLVPLVAARLATVADDAGPASFAWMFRTLHAWGAASAPAAPALAALLRHPTAAPFAALALGGIGPVAATGAGPLLHLADDHPDAAWAYHRLGGDPALAVARLVAHTTGTWSLPALRHLADLGPVAVTAVDHLRALTSADDWTRVEAAHALWRVTGDATAAVPVLMAVAAPLADGDRLPVRRAALCHLSEHSDAAGAAGTIAAAVLADPRRLGWSGGWRAFVEDEETRAAAARIIRPR